MCLSSMRFGTRSPKEGHSSYTSGSPRSGHSRYLLLDRGRNGFWSKLLYCCEELGPCAATTVLCNGYARYRSNEQQVMLTAVSFDRSSRKGRQQWSLVALLTTSTFMADSPMHQMEMSQQDCRSLAGRTALCMILYKTRTVTRIFTLLYDVLVPKPMAVVIPSR